ncbi:hypothetical protein D8M04_19585 [Oceanobacillus piezotolerans]|uniref:Uncharacterized protein n=1 Tax=Oceanobacillus piezotolerans TaxID=2448030 RepID=A0A498DCX1_9BACI|nr:hypothetical protein [Oceanobacillus piezotolerans]RLL39988.1 hypothetical protein D8M04_19585 [Oceanobacillus piezotolerans]
MKTELTFYDIAEDKDIFQTPVKSTGDLFIPIEGDTLLVDGWGYIVSRREFYYENDTTKITVFCTRERKKR